MLYLIIFILVIFAVLWGISIYFVRIGKLNVRDWSLKALGLPQGSVRALLAFLLLFLLVFSIMTGTKLPDLPDWLVGILGTVIGFYFGAAMVAPAPSQPSKAEETTPPKSR